MVYVQRIGREGVAKKYLITLRSENVEAMVTPSKAWMRLSGEELDDTNRAVVLEELLEASKSGEKCSVNGELSDVLQAFGEKVVETANYVQPAYEVPRDIKEETKRVFGEWSGSPTREQRKYMQNYGLEFVKTSEGYPKIRVAKKPGVFRPVSKTPRSKGGAGRGVTGDLINYLLPVALTLPGYLS